MWGLKERVWTAATLLSLSTPGLVWGPAASATPGRLLEMQTLRSYSRHNHNLPFTISQVMCIHIEGREALFFSPFFFYFLCVFLSTVVRSAKVFWGMWIFNVKVLNFQKLSNSVFVVTVIFFFFLYFLGPIKQTENIIRSERPPVCKLFQNMQCQKWMWAASLYFQEIVVVPK